jgi:Fe-S-cluster containining protein
LQKWRDALREPIQRPKRFWININRLHGGGLQRHQYESTQMKLKVRLPTAERIFAVDLDLPGEAAGHADLVPVLHKLASALTAFQLDGLPQPPSCRSGCSACCKQLVPVNEPEMHAMAELMDQLESEHRERVTARFEALRSRLDSSGLTERLHHPPIDPAAYQLLMRDYFELGIDCPFLENSACSIYTDRPSLCRQYNVTSPAELCDNPFETDILMAPMPAFIDNLCSKAYADLHKTKIKTTPIPLALEWVEQNPNHLPPVPLLPILNHILALLEQAMTDS